MRIDIIRQSDELKREVWSFSLRVEVYTPELRLDSYTVQTRRTKRCRTWDIKDRWGNIDRREDTLPTPPPIPEDVKTELYARLREEVAKLPIKIRR